MSSQEEMRRLGQGILTAHRERVQTIKRLKTCTVELRTSTRDMLGEMAGTREATASRLRADLAKDTADLKANVGTQLKGFDDAHAAMASKLHGDLATYSNDLQANVGAHLTELGSTREAMASRLRADLAKDTADLKTQVGAQLKGFDDAHAAMTSSLDADLAKYTAALESHVDTQLKGFRGELRELATARAEGQAEWWDAMSTMAAHRQSREAAFQETPASAGAGTLVADKPSEAPQGTEGEVTGVAGLGERTFAYLANHPDGAKLVELEQEFQATRFQMVHVISSLMDENKVEKRDLLYFAI